MLLDVNFDPVADAIKDGLLLNLKTATKCRAFSGEHLWLNLPHTCHDRIRLLAGLEKPILPYLYVSLFPALSELIDDQCIYPANSDNYFLEITENNALRLRYQQISGSRNLGVLHNGTIQALLVAAASQLMLSGQEGVANAPQSKIPDSVKGELQKLIVDGDKLVLPQQELMHYLEIKSLLNKAQGKYRRGTFVFPSGINPAHVLQTLLSGEVINSRKESQSFFTPALLAEEVCDSAGPVEGKRFLEPSAGDGALADRLKEKGANVVVVENFLPNILALKTKGYDVVERDFLSISPNEIGLFDGIVANPPFTMGKDIDHVYHMWKFIKPGGVLSVITSTSWRNGAQKKQKAFAEFLSANDAFITDIPAGTFKESGTGVATLHIRMKKAA